MLVRAFIATVFCCASASAWAADAPATSSLPILARTPQAEASPWTGLYVGTEIFAIGGGKGVKGGVGGGGYAGYERELPSGWVVGIEGSTGYLPSLYKYSAATGYDYAQTKFQGRLRHGPLDAVRDGGHRLRQTQPAGRVLSGRDELGQRPVPTTPATS